LIFDFCCTNPAFGCEILINSCLVLLQSQSGSSQLLYCPSTVKSSTVAVNHLAVAAAVMSPSDGEQKPPAFTSLSSSNGISALSTPLVASLMLHPSASSFQLVSAIPAAAHLTTVPSRAAGAPSLQYIVPPLALSDTGGKIMQMVSAGVQPTVCSLLYFVIGIN